MSRAPVVPPPPANMTAEETARRLLALPPKPRTESVEPLEEGEVDDSD